jgi:uridylate kinase
MPDPTPPGRLLLKLSGEALMGAGDFGIDPDVLARVAADVAGIVGMGVQVGVVIGGGNIFRGAGLAGGGFDRVRGDHIGMLATVMNSLALQDHLGRIGVDARTLSAFRIDQVCEHYTRDRAVRHLEAGRVVILSGGTGNPYFTTDTAASLRAMEIGADVVLKGTKVDGVYSSDPAVDAEAVRYDRLSFTEALTRKLGVMDATAMSLCRDNDMPIMVFNINEPGNLLRAVRGEAVGTMVREDADA